MRKVCKSSDQEMLFACIVEKRLLLTLMQNITLKLNISLHRVIHVNFVISIVGPNMHWTATYLKDTEVTDKIIERFCTGFHGDDRLDELASLYLTKLSEGGFICSLCNKISRDAHAGKSHLDSKHFPSEVGYFCKTCGKHCKTKNALSCHMSMYHRKK